MPMLLAAVLASGAVDAPPVVPYLPGEVRLDGRLEEDAWREALRVDDGAFTQRWVADARMRDPSPFTLRLFHDGSKLYVALASYDRFVESAASPENADGLYAFSIARHNAKPLHYRLRFANPDGVAAGDMLNTPWAARVRGPFNDTEHEGGGYVVEFAVTLKNLGVAPGELLSLNAIVQDHDANPGGGLRAPQTQFARFAWGTLENDNVRGYRRVRLAPVNAAALTTQTPRAPASAHR